MKTRKLSNINSIFCLLTLLILIIFTQTAIVYGADRLLVRPQDQATAQSKAMINYKVYENRQGPIILTPDTLPTVGGAPNSKAGIRSSSEDVFLISFFADANYEIIVDSITEQADGTRIVSGKIRDHNLKTFVLTIASDGFVITLQDMSRNLLYRATGNSLSGLGTVTEIDMKKIPPMIR